MIEVDQSKFDFSYMAWDVAMTLEECKCENIPCEYLGMGRTDSDNAKSGYYPRFKIELDGFVITDLHDNEVSIYCKETGEGGLFNRDAYNTRKTSIAEFYAKNF
jgi:hypothetical protein